MIQRVVDIKYLKLSLSTFEFCSIEDNTPMTDTNKLFKNKPINLMKLRNEFRQKTMSFHHM